MAPKTLYDVVRPICWNLNIFGYNLGNEKPAGWVRRSYKLALKCLLLYVAWRKMTNDCKHKREYAPLQVAALILNSLVVSSFCLQFFFVKEGEMEEVMERMKQHPLGKMSQKNLGKQLLPFKIYTTLFVICFLIMTTSNLFETFADFELDFLVRTVLNFIDYEYRILILQFPCLVCILPCIVACYCRAEMEEAIKGMKRIKSPLRRAKASAKLIEKYQQLNELASVTDRALSTAMYFMKWLFFVCCAAFVLSNAMLINQPDEMNPNYKAENMISYEVVLFFNFFIVLYFPLFQYFYLAPSANQMFERMNRAMVDCGAIDDQWLSRDPIARPYLLKMRMEVVEPVSHMATEDPPFTLFGDVLDNDISYVVILELIDMCNTLFVHELNEEMTLKRIYYDFILRCIDC